MAVYTWGQMFALVLRDSGVAAQGQTPNSQMTADAKMRCNMMLSGWQVKRWLVYHLVDTSVHCDGSLFYGLGPGEAFDMPRVDQIDAAFARQVNPAAQPDQPDFWLTPIKAYEDYAKLTLKRLSAGPAIYFFYDSGFPTGKVYPWPLMNDQYDLHILTKVPLPEVGGLTDDIVLPPEYQEAIYANSIVRTRAAFRLKPDPYYVALAKTSLQTLRSANFQVANLMMPAALKPVAGSGYNIFSDTWGPGPR